MRLQIAERRWQLSQEENIVRRNFVRNNKINIKKVMKKSNKKSQHGLNLKD